MSFLRGLRHARTERTRLTDDQIAGIVFCSAFAITVVLLGLTVFAIGAVVKRNYPGIELRPYRDLPARQVQAQGLPA